MIALDTKILLRLLTHDDPAQLAAIGRFFRAHPNETFLVPDIVLVEATPDGHRELARLPALKGKTWNNPVLAGDLLLVRNDREAACYRVALATGGSALRDRSAAISFPNTTGYRFHPKPTEAN